MLQLQEFRDNLQLLCYVKRVLYGLLELEQTYSSDTKDLDFFVPYEYYELASDLALCVSHDENTDHFFKDDKLFHKLLIVASNGLVNAASSVLASTKLNCDKISWALSLIKDIDKDISSELDSRIKKLEENPNVIIESQEEHVVNARSKQTILEYLIQYRDSLTRLTQFHNETETKDFWFSGWSIIDFWEKASELHSDAYEAKIQNLPKEEWLVLATYSESIWKTAKMLMMSKHVKRDVFDIAVSTINTNIDYVKEFVNKLILKHKKLTEEQSKEAKKSKSEE